MKPFKFWLLKQNNAALTHFAKVFVKKNLFLILTIPCEFVFSAYSEMKLFAHAVLKSLASGVS